MNVKTPFLKSRGGVLFFLISFIQTVFLIVIKIRYATCHKLPRHFYNSKGRVFQIKKEREIL